MIASTARSYSTTTDSSSQSSHQSTVGPEAVGVMLMAIQLTCCVVFVVVLSVVVLLHPRCARQHRAAADNCLDSKLS